jgi:hypothetical protein
MPSKKVLKPHPKKPLKTKNMADKTMPPNDPMPSPDQGAGMSPEAEMAPPASAPGGDGSVMISMPKVAFDAIHQLIMQLAQGADNLAQSVNQQAGAGAPASGAPMMPPGGPGGPAESMGGGDDEEFLKQIAAEGNK